MNRYITERCVFDEEYDPEEMYESLISEIESNYIEKINWRKAKSVLDYIKESLDNGEDIETIKETACHQIDELLEI